MHQRSPISDCAPGEDSDQPGHPPSLIKVFAVRMKKAWVLSYPLSAQQRLIRLGGRPGWSERLIRLGGCPGWSESSLGAYPLCWFCHDAAFMSAHLRRLNFFFTGHSCYFINFVVPRFINMSRIMTKPVYAICDQQRRRSPCARSLLFAP